MERHADDRLRLIPGRVARIEINHPARRNAISQAMWAALPAICATIAADPAIRVVLLCAADQPGVANPTFSAGADISEFAGVYATPASTAAYNRLVRQAQAALRDLPRPMIAVVAGACIGGGCGLALACDLRFAAMSAQFAITPARLGLAYSPEDTAQLVEKVGPACAKDMLFSARMVPASEALAIGLIDRVEPDADLWRAVEAYAGALADLSPRSIATAKATINALSEPHLRNGAALQQAFDDSFSSADFAEGRAAFLARRPPVF